MKVLRDHTRLNRKEYRLLALLMAYAGELVPRETLLTQLWGYVPKTRTRTLDVHIGRLWQKLGHEGRRIETIFGKGYRFSPSRDGRHGLLMAASELVIVAG